MAEEHILKMCTIRKNKLLFIIFLCLFYSGFSGARTLFFGDSLTAIYANSGHEFIRENITVEYVSGSGLLNENKMNWPEFVNKIDLRKYNNIIISLGTNDFVKYTPRDSQTYYARLFKLIFDIQKQNPLATIIWVSPPHLKNPEHEKYLINTRGIIKVSAGLMNVKYVDINQPHILGDHWQPVIDGQKIRTDDGIHITRAGGLRVIRELTKNMNKYD